MKTNYVLVEGIKLAYYQNNPEAENTLFFIHGNSTSAKTWSRQLKSECLSSYRLIAFDLPAHGESDSLKDSHFNYSLPELGKIMSVAIKQLAKDNHYLLIGVSLGTNIIAEMLSYDVYPKGIVLIGSCVIGGEFSMDRIFKKGIDLHAGFTDAVPENELKDYSKLAFSSEKQIDQLDFSNDFNNVKDNFRSKMFGTVIAENYSNEIHLLQQQKLLYLIIFGEDEKVCETDYLDNAGLNLWQGHTFKIKNAGHFINTDQSDILNDLITEYAKDIFK